MAWPHEGCWAIKGSACVSDCRLRVTRWFKYDRDKLWLVYTQIVPVIFEPPCISWFQCKQRMTSKASSRFYDETFVCLWYNSARIASVQPHVSNGESAVISWGNKKSELNSEQYILFRKSLIYCIERNNKANEISGVLIPRHSDACNQHSLSKSLIRFVLFSACQFRSCRLKHAIS